MRDHNYFSRRVKLIGSSRISSKMWKSILTILRFKDLKLPNAKRLMRLGTLLKEPMKKKRKHQSIRDRRRQLQKKRKKQLFFLERTFRFKNQSKFLTLKILNCYLFAARHALIGMLIVLPGLAHMTCL